MTELPDDVAHALQHIRQCENCGHWWHANDPAARLCIYCRAGATQPKPAPKLKPRGLGEY